MSITLILKFVCPIIVLCIIWIWNRMRRERKLKEEKKRVVPCLEFCILDEKVRKELIELVSAEVLGKLESTTKVYRIMLGEKIIAVALFSWPSSLWHFREERGEETSLGAYSHLHWFWVSEEYRLKGYLDKFMDNVIADTHRISAGLTIDLEDPELKELFRKKYEFTDCGNYMKLEYGNWS